MNPSRKGVLNFIHNHYTNKALSKAKFVEKTIFETVIH